MKHWPNATESAGLCYYNVKIAATTTQVSESGFLVFLWRLRQTFFSTHYLPQQEGPSQTSFVAYTEMLYQ